LFKPNLTFLNASRSLSILPSNMIPKRGLMRAVNKLTLICVLQVLVSTIGYGQGEYFSRAEVLEDFEYFKEKLLQKHPGVGLYKSLDEFNSFFEHLEVADSVSTLDLYGVFSDVHQVILDGHTQVYQEYFLQWENEHSGLYIPFQPYWDGQKLYLFKAYSYQSMDWIGQEIVSINGVESKKLIEGMLARMPRDGYQSGYAIWELNTYFYEHYSWFFGCFDDYSVVLKHDAATDTVDMKGILFDELLDEIEAAEPFKKSLTLQLNKEKTTALLTIKSWTNYYLSKEHKQKLIRELREATKEIERNDIAHLIIDIRDNPGGRLKFSEYLLSYLLDEPFLMNEGFKRKKDGVVVDARGEKMGLRKPKRKTFKGDVYVLINEGCFSNSSIFSATLQRYDRAIFIGEETGGSQYSMCGHPFFYMLPNTGISVSIPTLQMILKPTGEDIPHGVLPDYEVRPSFSNLVNGEDVALNKAMELISGSKP